MSFNFDSTCHGLRIIFLFNITMTNIFGKEVPLPKVDIKSIGTWSQNLIIRSKGRVVPCSILKMSLSICFDITSTPAIQASWKFTKVAKNFFFLARIYTMSNFRKNCGTHSRISNFPYQGPKLPFKKLVFFLFMK